MKNLFDRFSLWLVVVFGAFVAFVTLMGILHKFKVLE